MYMHLNVTPSAAQEANAEPAALVFRTVLRGAVYLSWRNRRVRLDEDAWLVLDGREGCALQADPQGRAELLADAVSHAERDAAFALAAASLVEAADALARGQNEARVGVIFADNLRSLDGPAGRRLIAIARSRNAGRPQAEERSDRVALVQESLGEELALRRKAARIACVKLATREQLLRRILLATDFIASRHDEPISLDEMARAASLSRFHFVRLFSLVHGETPHAFLLRKRTAVARRHLAVGSACSEAATRAGFGSRSALFRNLRKTALLATGHDPCCLSA